MVYKKYGGIIQPETTKTSEKNIFLDDCNEIYKEVEYLIGFANEKTIEPEEDIDKLIYKINLILSNQNDKEIISKIIELIDEYDGDIKQISRIIFVLLYNRDLMNKERLNGESFGEKLLIDIIQTDKIDEKLFIEEYEFIYNEKFDMSLIPPSLEDKSKGGNMYKNYREK